MILVAFALSILIGISLGLLGGGGSILTVPILVYVLGVDAHAAVATSLIVVGVTAAAGSIGHARAGRVQWKTAFVFGGASMVGAFATGKFAHLVPSAVLLGGFALMMVATAAAMLRGKKANASKVATRELPVLKIVAEGIVVGGVTGLVGAGGGFLVVPALVLLGGLSMETAVGTSLVVIALKSFAALGGHLSHALVDWRLAAVVTVAAVGGSFVGGWLAGRLSPERLRRAFAWLVLAMGAFMLVQQLPPYVGLAWTKSLSIAIAAGAGLATAVAGVLIEVLRRPSLPPRPRTSVDLVIDPNLEPQHQHG